MALLRDYLTCSCRYKYEMFPVKFDKKQQKITYKCISCGREETRDVKDLVLGPEEGNKFFTLTDKGEMWWKQWKYGGSLYDTEIGHNPIQAFVMFPEFYDIINLGDKNEFEVFQSDMHPVLHFPLIRSIEGTGYSGRNERIESVKAGDPLILKTDWNSEYYSPVSIEVFNDRNETLGFLKESYGKGINDLSLAMIAAFIERGGVSAKVSSVTPLSKRRKNAKYALMDVELSMDKELYDAGTEKHSASYDLDMFDIRSKGILLQIYGRNEKVTIPEITKSINGDVFYHPLSVKELIIPESVEYLERDAFKKCRNLKRISISKALISKLDKDGIDHYFNFLVFVDECVRNPEENPELKAIVNKWLKYKGNRRKAINEYLNSRSKLSALLHVLDKPMDIKEIIEYLNMDIGDKAKRAFAEYKLENYTDEDDRITKQKMNDRNERDENEKNYNYWRKLFKFKIYCSDDDTGDKYHASISGYKGNEKRITVPARINGHEVSVYEIDCGKAEEVAFEEGITFIGSIKGEKLIKIDLPDSLTNLREIIKCDALKYLKVPDSVVEMYDGIYECKNLEQLRLPKNLEIIGPIDECPSLKEIDLGDNARGFHPNFFARCDGLERIIVHGECFNVDEKNLPELIKEIEKKYKITDHVDYHQLVLWR